ncbi:hypothetical protein [Micromonospora taraxaci]|uniref:hypothetical protein n=1 Tax=Micromonospora taraxaci TaxID=1316803 RepID=UPI0033B7D429
MSLVAVRIASWNVSRLAAPGLVGWQISLTDEFADAPLLPDLPVPAEDALTSPPGRSAR